LGANHLQTGKIQMDFGELHLKLNQPTNAIERFTEAYLIFKSQFGRCSLQTAETASCLATLMEQSQRLEEAYEYIASASSSYRAVFGSVHYHTLKALWT
jgi:hypothetical protein